MSTKKQVELAMSLPPRLIRFFTKFPPPALFPQVASSITTPTSTTTTPSDPNASPVSPPISNEDAEKPDLPYPNPFLPIKSHVTGRWRGPVYGLRKQAELVKLAQEHGVLDLLPWTIKKPGERHKMVLEKKLQSLTRRDSPAPKAKGKRWERTLQSRLEMRHKAMLEMPALIQEWKLRGHGRGWKKWPSGKAKF